MTVCQQKENTSVTDQSAKGPNEQLLGEIEARIVGIQGAGAALLFSGQVCHLLAFSESK